MLPFSAIGSRKSGNRGEHMRGRETQHTQRPFTDGLRMAPIRDLVFELDSNPNKLKSFMQQSTLKKEGRRSNASFLFRGL